ncbi:MAG: class I adenylate cyclase [Desulfovibrionaceae bacterium]
MLTAGRVGGAIASLLFGGYTTSVERNHAQPPFFAQPNMMTDQQHPSSRIVEALRVRSAFFDSAPARPFDLLQELAGQPEALEAGPAPAPSCSVAAVLVHQLLEEDSGDAALLRLCVKTLLRLGGMGRLCLCEYLRTSTAYTLPQLTGALKDLSGVERLLMAHELLARPGSNNRALMGWARELLDFLAGSDPHEVLGCLVLLGREEAPAAYAVKRALLRGEFGKWLNRKLGRPMGDVMFGDLCLAAAALEDDSVTARLAVRIAGVSDATAVWTIPLLCSLSVAGNQLVAKAVVERLKTAGPELQLACLDGLRALQWRNTGLAAAGLYKTQPGLRRAVGLRMALSSSAGFEQFIEGLPLKDQTLVLAENFSAVCRLAPAFVRECAKGAARSGVHQLGAKQAAALKKALDDAQASPVPDVSPLSVAGLAPRASREQGWGGLFSRKGLHHKRALARALDGRFDVSDQKLGGSVLRGASVSGKTFVRTDLSGGRLEEIRFEKVRFSNVDCGLSGFSNCVFSQCDFSGVWFDQARFADCTFEQCAFDSCDFSLAQLEKTLFTDCRLRRTLFAGAAFEECNGSANRLEISTMAGAAFSRCRFEASLLRGVDLSGAAVRDSRLLGLECEDVRLSQAAFFRSDVLECEFTNAAAPGMRVVGCQADDPVLLAAERRSREAGMAVLCEAPDSEVRAEALSSGAAFAADTARAYLLELDVARREEAMAANDHRRRRWGVEKMAPRQADFFKLLPYLLHTDAFELRQGIPGVPGCAVDGYAPKYSALRLAEEFFPGGRTEQPGEALAIEAVYAIGSLGSLAQTGQSDVDYWVCCDMAGQPDEALDRLRTKLDALSRWAEEAFGLEVHFFAMDMNDVRANDFGLSDEESSGSAQALLLKEEFYRTAVRIAGRRLFWWVTPPGIDEASYKALYDRSRDYPLAGRPRLCDAGYLGSIPPSEYFGACLWQIVKAVKSPYKSVMKLGLLEKYAHQSGQGGLMLCERIKANIFDRRRGAVQVDPYAALFKELAETYWAAEDKEAVRLVREAFAHKAKLERFDAVLGFPHRAEEDQLVRLLFGPKATDQEAAGKARDGAGFERAAQLAGMVNRFMMGAYGRIQEQLSVSGDSRLISSEDLTTLGRKIFAAFAAKPGKVERLPFFDAGDAAFSELVFSAEKAVGKKTQWLVKGCPKGVKSTRKDMLEIRRDDDPVRLLVWFAANNLCNGDLRLLCDGDIAPLSASDVQALMDKLRGFFPAKEIFEVSPAETLKAERITRALFVLNLEAPPKLKKLERLMAVYATNWGELYCRRAAGVDAEAVEKPALILKRLAPDLLSPAPLLDQFSPRKSACPKLALG